MASGHLSISYHRETELGLSPEEERALVGLFGERGLSAHFQTRPVRVKITQLPGSLVVEALGIGLVMAGGIIAKSFLEELGKTLYKFFYNRIKRHVEIRDWPKIGYAVLIDLHRDDGQRYHVVAYFSDSETLEIAMFRLHQYLSTHTPDSDTSVDPTEGFLKLDLPGANYNPGHAILLGVLSVFLIGLLLVPAPLSMTGFHPYKTPNGGFSFSFPSFSRYHGFLLCTDLG